MGIGMWVFVCSALFIGVYLYMIYGRGWSAHESISLTSSAALAIAIVVTLVHHVPPKEAPEANKVLSSSAPAIQRPY